MGETALAKQEYMDCVNNVLGDLREKRILDATAEVQPIKRKSPSDKATKKSKKTSQWEIREEIAKKKREQILNEVRLKREKEEEQKQRAALKRREEVQRKEKDRSERARKREAERQKMKADLKKRMAKPSKSGLEFEFIGVAYGEEGHEEDAEQPEGSKDEEETKGGVSPKPENGKGEAYSHCQIFAGPYKQSDEEAASIIEKKYADYVTNLEGFLDDENVSDEEDSDSISQTPKFLHVSSTDDRDNVYNDGNDDTLDQSTDSSVNNSKVKSSKPPSIDDDTSNWDFFAYLTDKYGYEKFKKGLDIVTKSNMLRFSEDGEKKIKEDLSKIIDKEDDVDGFYSDCSSYIIMTASLGKFTLNNN